RSQRERFTRHRFRDAFHLVEHPAGLDPRDPELDPALALALAHFQRLLGDRLVREHADPDLAAALHVTGDRAPAGFDLPRGQVPAAERLQAELTEADPAAALREAAVAALLLLPEFRSLRL